MAKRIDKPPAFAAQIPAAASPHTSRRWLNALIVALLAIIPYLNTLTAEHVLDDLLIVKENPQVRHLSNIPKLFVSHYWSGMDWIGDRGLYRPLTMSTYTLNYALHGEWAAGYHAANLLLHAAVSVLLLVLLRRLFDNEPAALLAAVWFAVHPLHTEAVAGIVGRAEILAAIGIFGCLYGYERARIAHAGQRHRAVPAWMAFSLVAYAVGCFSKEIGLVAPAMIVVLELLRPERRWLLKARPPAIAVLAGCAIIATTYLALRAHVIVEATVPHPGWRTTGGPVRAPERIFTALRVALEYVGLTLWPAPLSADYWIADVPLATSPLAPGTLAAILLLIAAIVVVALTWRRLPAVAFGLLAFAIALFPVSNIPFPIGVMKAERLMYTPSAGLLIAAAAAVVALAIRRPSLRKPIWIACAVVTVALGARTLMRNFDWQTNRSLAEATLRVSPDSPMMNSNLGLWYRAQGDHATARSYIERARDAEPLNGHPWSLLAELDRGEGKLEAAVAGFEHAAKLAPNTAQILIDLARTYFQLQRWPDAARTLERVRELRPYRRASYVNLAGVYMNMGESARALSIAEEGIRRFPDKGSLYAIAADAHQALGHADAAERCRRRAMELGIEHDEDE